MRKLRISESDVMRIAIQQEIARSQESRYDHRLHGILLMTQGLSCYEVSHLLGENATTIQRWVNRFDSQGFSGLQEGERPGRPRRLDEVHWQSVDGDLRRNPREFGYAQNLWDGKLLAHHLAEVHGVALGVRQCQRMFRQLGFRLRKPRPLIAKADPTVQAAYKKTPPLGPRRKR